MANTFKFDEVALEKELKFRTSRSSGKGGQHVNKVSTRVEAIFNILDSEVLSEQQKERLAEKLKNRISEAGNLSVTVQKSRSQLKNKEFAIAQLFLLIDEALHVPKKRKKLKVPRSVKESRLKNKRLNSEKKKNRGKIAPEH